jgi:hypothetical protein
MDLTKLKHPGWVGVVLPLALAIGSTLTPGTVRVWLLVAAVVAAIWIFHTTEFASRNLRKTLPAAGILLAIAVALFFVGRAFDSHARPTEEARKIPPSRASQPDELVNKPPTEARVEVQPTPKVTQATRQGKTLRKTPNEIAGPQDPPIRTKTDAPLSSRTQTGPVLVQPGGAVSFGQQGGVTVGTLNVVPVAPMPVLTYSLCASPKGTSVVSLWRISLRKY